MWASAESFTDMVPVSARAEEHRDTPHPGLPVSIQGSKAAIQERNKQARPTSEASKKARPAGKAVKIRNYNIKDWNYTGKKCAFTTSVWNDFLTDLILMFCLNTDHVKFQLPRK